LSLLLIAVLAFAGALPVARSQATVPEAAKQARFDTEFAGTAIGHVVEFLSERLPSGMNIVTQGQMDNIRTTLKLRNVTVLEVLEALRFSTGNRIEIGNLTDNIIFVRKVVEPINSDSKPECRIYSLATYLSSRDENEQKRAIVQLEDSLQLAIEMLRQADPASDAASPQLKVNSSTKLLIAVGRPADLGVVSQLVSALEGHVVRVPAPTKGQAAPLPGIPGLDSYTIPEPGSNRLPGPQPALRR
jgi:hypothetical protein